MNQLQEDFLQVTLENIEKFRKMQNDSLLALAKKYGAVTAEDDVEAAQQLDDTNLEVEVDGTILHFWDQVDQVIIDENLEFFLSRQSIVGLPFYA